MAMRFRHLVFVAKSIIKTLYLLILSDDNLIQVAVKFISANLSFALSDAGEYLRKL